MPGPELRPLLLMPPQNAWQQFLKNIRIIKALALASFQADLEYRANFVSRVATDIFWYAAQILTFETLFLHTDQIGGWNAAQVRIFLGVLFVVDAIYMILFHDNMDQFSEKVRKGDLDLLLMKPVSSQLLMSVQRMATALFGNLLLGVAWLIFALYHYEDFSALRLLWLAVLIPAGVMILYTVRFMISTTSVIFVRADSLQYMWYQVYKLGMRPDSIYVPWFRIVLLTALPVLAIASVPARSLIAPADPALYAYVVVLCAVLLWISGRTWRFALSKYTSASS